MITFSNFWGTRTDAPSPNAKHTAWEAWTIASLLNDPVKIGVRAEFEVWWNSHGGYHVEPSGRALYDIAREAWRAAGGDLQQPIIEPDPGPIDAINPWLQRIADHLRQHGTSMLNSQDLTTAMLYGCYVQLGRIADGLDDVKAIRRILNAEFGDSE